MILGEESISYQNLGGLFMAHPLAEAPLRAHPDRFFGTDPGNAALQLFYNLLPAESAIFFKLLINNNSLAQWANQRCQEILHFWFPRQLLG